MSQQQNDTNTLSIVAMVLGGIALFLFPPIFGIAGLVCGIVAKTKNERLAPIAIGVAVGGLILGMALGALVFSAN